MSLPFTNIHTHVFNSQCAPDRFLRILPMNFVRRAPRIVKGILDSNAGRKIIHGLFKVLSVRDSNKRRAIDKYVAFLDVGTEASQLEVFQTAFEAGKSFDPNIRIVGLTMNMDYMDTMPSKHQISYETQLEEIISIKRYYPNHFFPFLGIDPRHKTGVNLVEWATPYFESGVVYPDKVLPYFSGIKLYPALGFFPFDPGLEEIYRYAQEKKLPVMTHCTRVGSQYIGDRIENLIPDHPPMITVVKEDKVADMPAANQAITAANASIVDRIAKYKERKWIRNSKIGDNDLSCDLFGHPENYIPVLEKFPNLKLCLAHMGGSSEMLKSTEKTLADIRKVDLDSWFEHIGRMMKKYPNLYTDISYTLADFADEKGKVYAAFKDFLETDSPHGKLGDRVLFGTDFFMTEQERREPELYTITKKNLADWWDRLGRDNPRRYLGQPV